MAKPSIEEMVMLAQQLRQTPHRERGAFVARHANALQVTPKTLYEWIGEITKTDRKPRSDKGTSSLTREEAMLVSSVLRESRKQTGKQLGKVSLAVEILRSNGMIRADVIDKNTGEIRDLSDSAIERALRCYGLHPDQMDRPAPAQALRTSHPNHLWQIDASLCVLYYLPRDKGLAVMDHAVFYHNKPGNSTKIESDRVWRYAITDHTSGAGYLEYVYGGESGENLASVFINAMQYRGKADPFHGVPVIAMLDPGSANTGALFKNLCASLGVRLQINGVHNPRAKGQVEGFHNIIERDFESRLKLAPISNLDELNQRAWQWMRSFNAVQVHRRTGMTRYAAWSRITASQLIKAPSIEICRNLTHSKPEPRTINGYMQVSWRANQYDVGHIPGINVGDKVDVATNPWREGSVRIIVRDTQGLEQFHEADMIRRDDFGFGEGAALIGTEFKRHTDTPTVTAQKLLDKLAMEANTQGEVDGKRKAKTIPFGGKVDSFKPIEDAEPNLPSWIEKRGTESPVQTPDIHLRPLSLVETAKQLYAKLGDKWKPEFYAELKTTYPMCEVPQEHLDDLRAYFAGDASRKPASARPALRVVGGG